MQTKDNQEFEKVVDLENVIKKSNSTVLKKMPAFVVQKIAKIIRQDDLNLMHNRNRQKVGIDYVNALLADMNIELDIKGSQNVPQGEKYVFVANHPLGGLDALAYLSAINRFWGEVVSPSNELFMHIPNLHPLIVGINVFGRNTREAIAKVEEAFKSDVQIMIFPAGEVSRKTQNRIEDPLWQKTFVTKAIQHKRNIVPAFIEGKNSDFFYNLALWRKRFGIKQYIETLYLPDEMLKQKNKKIVVNFRKPVEWQTLDRSRAHHEWALEVRNMVYNMKQ